MKNPCDVIQALEADNSRLAKEKILKNEVAKGNTEFFDGVRLALDSYITFGVKQVPKHSGPDGQGLPMKAFKVLADQLATRQLTGGDARKAIELALSASTQDQWNDWYRRILIKDLRCGMSESTVNKILKGTNIAPVPVFEVMLAHDGANHEKKIAGKKLLELKYDGVRTTTIVDVENRSVVMYSRNGKVLSNFSHITDGLLKVMDDFGRSYVIDGEIMSTSFQALMTQVNRKSDVDAGDARLMAFDVLPLSEFRLGESVLGQKRRSALLRSFKPILDKVGHIDITEQVEVDLDSYVGEVQMTAFNKDAIEKGLEGIMIKDPNATYVCKRSTAWLKQKPFIEVSLKIVGYEEGTGKNVGKLGALICEGEDDGKMIATNVGSGFPDIDRDDLWQSKDSLIGQMVEVRADALTKNRDSDDVWSLRFPRFRRFRGFAAGEKI